MTRSERGVVTTELVIVMPILIAFLFLLLAAGRLVDARSDIVGAAHDAARIASLQTNADDAEAQARLAARDTVSGERLNCVGGPRVTTTPYPAFERGADIHVVVTCTVDTRDLTGVGLPVRVTLTGEAWERIDAYRSLP